MENEGDSSNMGRKSVRISQPFESTRCILTGIVHDSLAKPAEGDTYNMTKEESQDIKPDVEHPDDSIINAEISLDESMSSDTKNCDQFKNDLHGLNNKLHAYMDRARRNEACLTELSNARRALEKQIEHMKQAHSEQVAMLRLELDERVQKAVMAEEKLAQLQDELAKHERAVAARDESLETQRSQLDNLERALVLEKQQSANASRRAEELKGALVKTHEERESLKNECTRLKVEAAKLQERVKVASLEITMQESKMSAVEKELLYSAHDVTNKVTEERKRLEAIGMEKLEELRVKHKKELDQRRKEFAKKLQEALQGHVSSEKYAAIQAEAKANLQRAVEAEHKLAERENRVLALKNENRELVKTHNEKMAEERARREKLNKRLLAQSRDQEEIRKEMETYRKLIENLDVDGNSFCLTPLGTKRLRTSLDIPSPTCNAGVHFRGSQESTPVRRGEPGTPTGFEARKALLKKALTPRKRTSSDGDGKSPPSTSERDCMMM